jgi:protein-tyrosine-phosphatase
MIASYGKDRCRIGVFASNETLEILTESGNGFFPLPYGRENDVMAASAQLFRALRKSDELGLDLIIVEAFPENGVGKAYMNRLNKASGSQIIEQSAGSGVLFICTGNTCRSPMAEYYVNYVTEVSGKHRITDSSAGIATVDGLMASDGAIEAMMKLYDIDISAHRSSLVRKENIESSDLVITMTQRHKKALISDYPEFSDRIHTFHGFIRGEDSDVPDPFGFGHKIYEDIAKEITGLADKLITKLSLRII